MGGLKRNCHLHRAYKMNDKKVAGIRETKYLGVTFTDKLNWNQHISHISGAANRMLGFLWRNLRSCPCALKEQAYKTYVRPKLEYCCTIWDPHQKTYVTKLEMVQHRAARFVTNTPHRRSDEDQISITALVEELGWQTLQERRRNPRLALLYKVKSGIVEVPQVYHPQLRDPQPRRGNGKEYVWPHAEVNSFKYSFLPRTVRDWNGLDATVVSADSLDSLKHLL